TIRRALKINPESWNLKMIEAGYMVLKGQREEGIRRFEEIQRPRGDVEFYESMVAWFYAVSRQRDKFYAQLEKALTIAHSTHILVWIEQDEDLDHYRNEPEFKELVARHRDRLLGGAGGDGRRAGSGTGAGSGDGGGARSGGGGGW
ncbi:MAG: hypothetical protein N3A38_15080, partial [Planctomycetota bacterium]|nr:hypothetical protein [Planctomycetota bacterium]